MHRGIKHEQRNEARKLILAQAVAGGESAKATTARVMQE